MNAQELRDLQAAFRARYVTEAPGVEEPDELLLLVDRSFECVLTEIEWQETNLMASFRCMVRALEALGVTDAEVVSIEVRRGLFGDVAITEAAFLRAFAGREVVRCGASGFARWEGQAEGVRFYAFMRGEAAPGRHTMILPRMASELANLNPHSDLPFADQSPS